MATFRLPALPSMRNGSGAPHPCICGCKQPTKRTWYPGHDGRATGWATRIERGIIKIDDVPANEQAGARYMLQRRANDRKAAQPELVEKVG